MSNKQELTQPTSPDYEFMSDIMAGKYDTQRIIEFLEESEKKHLTIEQLSEYLRAIKDTASLSIDAQNETKRVIDIAGTGGDGKHTVNISTLAALICAATNQVKVYKYGNRSASGICGSMDVLESVGIQIYVPPAQLLANKDKSNFVPLFARMIYPGARHVAEARTHIGRPTLFNLLFSLARPIQGDFTFLMGFSNPDSLQLASELLAHNKTSCLLVHGKDGTDEISVTGEGLTEYTHLRKGNVSRGELDYQAIFGREPIDIKALQIDSKEEATKLFLQSLNPDFMDDRTEAIRQSVLLNAAAALAIGTMSDQDDLNLSLKNSHELVSKTVYQRQAQLLLKTLQTTHI